PGTREQTHPVEMDFRYSEVFGRPSPEAYERLLLDVMAGDASRFLRREAVGASRGWVTQILDSWQQQRVRWPPEYQTGTQGAGGRRPPHSARRARMADLMTGAPAGGTTREKANGARILISLLKP